MSEIVLAKQALRKEIVANRKSKSTSGFTKHIKELVDELKPNRVAIYVSFGTEPDTKEFIAESKLPILIPVTHDEHLSWEILSTGETTNLVEGDLLLVPALAIDNKGNRLGRGKGYFDRELASLDKTIKVYAIVYEAEFLETLPTEVHDHRVQGLITEEAIRNLN